MKKFILSATAMLVLAGSSASAITLPNTQIAGKDKPKTTAPDPGPSTDSNPPCPLSDPTGCHIFD